MGTDCKTILRATLESYAALLFTNGVRYGAAVMVVTFFNPRLGLGGLIGAIAGNAAALLFSFPRDVIATGIYGISPLLTGIAIACFHPAGVIAYPLIIPAALLTMTLSTLLSDRLYKNFRIGSLSFAFAIVATVVSWRVLDHPVFGAQPEINPDWFEVFFSSLGAIIFVPKPMAGIGLFLVILVYSRTLAVLAASGFALGSALYIAMGGHAWDLAHGMVGLNFVLTAMAVGGVYLLAGPFTTLHAAGAVMMTALIALGIHKILAQLGLPVFSWPFNIATILWIGALNLRTIATNPRGTWGLTGSPENMASQVDLHSRAAVAEFAPKLPVIGEWTVTQGIEGEPTHRPPWSFAIDLEVMDEAGFPFRTSRAGLPGTGSSGTGSPGTPLSGGTCAHGIAVMTANDDRGERLESYYAFGAPVLAVADGVVVLAISGIFDNPPGASNTKDNFGNQVIIRHAEHLYSVYAHLKYLSARVRAGDVVRAGHVIAQCGSSGRSPRPHLHFHIQANDLIGSPTLPFAFSQFTIRDRTIIDPKEQIRFIESGLPELFDRVAAASSVRGSRPAPVFSPGRLQRFLVRARGVEHEETWKMDTDLWGGVRLTSFLQRSGGEETKVNAGTLRPIAEAVWRIDGRGMTAVAFSGSRACALYALFRAVSRLPSHISPRFRWADRPGAGHTLPWPLSSLRGVMLPFMSMAGSEMIFSATVTGETMRIESGNSRPAFRGSVQRSESLISTWDESGELIRLEFSSHGITRLSADRLFPSMTESTPLNKNPDRDTLTKKR